MEDTVVQQNKVTTQKSVVQRQVIVKVGRAGLWESFLWAAGVPGSRVWVQVGLAIQFLGGAGVPGVKGAGAQAAVKVGRSTAEPPPAGSFRASLPGRLAARGFGAARPRPPLPTRRPPARTASQHAHTSAPQPPAPVDARDD